MNPCESCVKVYEETPCNKLGHCAFEGTNEKPKKHEKIVFLIDGKPMKLPPSLKRYIDYRFRDRTPNYTIVRKRDGKEDE